MKKAFNIEVSGLVQGVGFRPFVYKLAKKHHLNGWVKNKNDCVEINVSGDSNELELFLNELKYNSPKIAKVFSLDFKEQQFEAYNDFEIIVSESASEKITEVSADLAVCEDCLMEMENQLNRINYPFINCTHCGPRFSIIQSLPYDRPNTTMSKFTMCDHCEAEYKDVNNRRFHAQPIACEDCGPHYQLAFQGKKIKGDDRVVEKVGQLIDEGKVVAIKGIGGYFMACDATNQEAVLNLRRSKKRNEKPFALMFKNLDTIGRYAWISEEEKMLLSSIQRPIVLLKHKKRFFPGVNDGLITVGAMLPYMPFHYLLFKRLKTDVIVLTSGNISEEPIAIDDNIALDRLGDRVDAVVSYNRQIHNRVDDSVSFIAGGATRLVRRSRGYAPEPIQIDFDCEGIFAVGAELSSVFAIGKDKRAILSQYIGDLKNYDTYKFYQESFKRYQQLFRFSPTLVACDHHPDYLSTRFAEEFDAPIVKIQHHHAHMASCLVENKHYGQAIGVCFDGTGYGTDGNIWGGEFLVGDLCGFTRPYHFEYVPITGGDMAAFQPWRSALSYLHFHGIDRKTILKFLPGIEKNEGVIALNSLERDINCPLSSSAGRLFDAIAGLIGLCDKAGYHAQAPMMLESLALRNCDDFYSVEIFDGKISFENTITDIIDDLRSKESIRHISTKFHNTIVDVIVRVCLRIREESQVNVVALSGGTFQNKYILERSIRLLSDRKFRVLAQKLVPSNDGGIALGQLAIAAAKKNRLCV